MRLSSEPLHVLQQQPRLLMERLLGRARHDQVRLHAGAPQLLKQPYAVSGPAGPAHADDDSFWSGSLHA